MLLTLVKVKMSQMLVHQVLQDSLALVLHTGAFPVVAESVAAAIALGIVVFHERENSGLCKNQRRYLCPTKHGDTLANVDGPNQPWDLNTRCEDKTSAHILFSRCRLHDIHIFGHVAQTRRCHGLAAPFKNQ